MIIAKNITKTYKPKKGQVVKALDNISLTLPKKGMVFILGKSGSGKSTLLNVLGGLDSVDSGEIFIKGESIKNFKTQHYDSYRNTYIGFIFQEYNILDEFCVGANIALALELQGEKATSQKVNEILRKVDLDDMALRKPNELSGGQKQRVAIARALIKNPDIIMADEPTGALDSATGKSIFDTLKKLSTEKLVLIVSHDREFAEGYADRIIELSDGKILSDVEKDNTINSNIEENNLEFYDNEILVKEKYVLTVDDLNMINEYLNHQNTPTTIKKSHNKNRYVFKDTNQSNIDKDTSGFKLIKSHLSLKNSFKIGASSLNHKKFKLVITIILSVIAFSLFGLADTIGSYDKEKTTIKSLQDSNIDYASFTKKQKHSSDIEKDSYYLTKNLSKEDIEYVKNSTDNDYIGIYNFNQTLDINDNLVFEYDKTKPNEANFSALFPSAFSGFSEFNNDKLKNFGYELLGGKLPDGNKNEVAISKYMFDAFKAVGYTSYDSNLNKNTKTLINDYNDLIGKTLSIGFSSKVVEFKITGIVDTNFDYNRFVKLTQINENTPNDQLIISYALQTELYSVQKYSLNCALFVGDGFYEHIINSIYSGFNEVLNATIHICESYDSPSSINIFFSRVNKLNNISDDEIFWLKEKTATLKDNQVLISLDSLTNSFDEPVYDFTELLLQAKTEYINNTSSYNKKRILLSLNKINNTDDEVKIESEFNIYVSSVDLEKSNLFHKDVVDGIKKLYLEKCKNYILSDPSDKLSNLIINYNSYFSTDGMSEFHENVEIMGIFLTDANDTGKFYYSSSIVLSDKLWANALNYSDVNIYNYAVGIMPKSTIAIKKIVSFENTIHNDIKYELNNVVSQELSMIDSILDVLKKVFFWIGFSFAIFACLMLTNFISTSISYKEREIGILRAIGSRTWDVFKIFFSESFIIAMINYFFTIITTVAFVILINHAIRDDVGLVITILRFGIRQIIVILLICVLVSAIATLLKVKKIASKKPIDAIRGH